MKAYLMCNIGPIKVYQKINFEMFVYFSFAPLESVVVSVCCFQQDDYLKYRESLPNATFGSGKN